MTKYFVKNTNINHNGMVYGEGKEIPLDETSAKKLKDFIEEFPEKQTTNNKIESKNQTNKTESNTKKDNKSSTSDKNGADSKDKSSDDKKDGGKDDKTNA